MFNPDLKIGQAVTNDQICEIFTVSPRGGDEKVTQNEHSCCNIFCIYCLPRQMEGGYTSFNWDGACWGPKNRLLSK